MKRLLPIPILFLSIFTHAQTVQEAEKLMYYEKFQSASQMLHEILQQDKRNGEAWWLLTNCYVHENKMKAIEDSFKMIPNDVDNIALIDCAKGELDLMRGKKEDAASIFRTALSFSKEKDPLILSDVAEANIITDSGNINYAIDLLNKAIKKDKSKAALYVELGNAYRKLKNGQEMYKAFNRALEIDPGNAEASYRLGLLFVSQNNPEQYLKYYFQAKQQGSSPQSGVIVRFILLLLLQGSGKSDGISAALHRMLR